MNIVSDVIPAQAGIRKVSYVLRTLDSRLRGNDTPEHAVKGLVSINIKTLLKTL